MLPESSHMSSKRRARAKLLRMCAGDWSDDEHIDHHCSILCPCTSFDDAVDVITDLIMESFMGSPPPVPAINRWNRVYPPLVWWMMMGAFHAVGFDACVLVADAAVKEEEEQVELVIDPLAAPSEDSHRIARVSRLKKMKLWCSSKDTLPKLLLGATVTLPALSLLCSLALLPRQLIEFLRIW